MKENQKTVYDYLDDLEYVQTASTIKFMGKCVIDSKYFNEALNNARAAIEERLEKARKIEVREQKIYEEAERKSEGIVREVMESIEKMDPVCEAEEMAKQILENAKKRAEQIERQAMETSDGIIQHGEKVKNELINQGHEFLERVLKSSIDHFDAFQNQLVPSLQAHKEKLVIAYEEITPMVQKEKEVESEEESKAS